MAQFWYGADERALRARDSCEQKIKKCDIYMYRLFAVQVANFLCSLLDGLVRVTRLNIDASSLVAA